MKLKPSQTFNQIQYKVANPDMEEKIQKLLEEHKYDIELVKDLLWKELSITKRKKDKLHVRHNDSISKDTIYVKFKSAKSIHQCWVVYGDKWKLLRLGDYAVFERSKEQLYAVYIKDGLVYSNSITEITELKSNNNMIYDLLEFHLKGVVARRVFYKQDTKLQSLLFNIGYPMDMYVNTDTMDSVFLPHLIPIDTNYPISTIEHCISIIRTLTLSSDRSVGLFSIFIRKTASELEKCILLVSMFIQLGLDAYVVYSKRHIVVINGQPSLFMDCEGNLLKKSIISITLVFNHKLLGINLDKSPFLDFNNKLRWHIFNAHKSSLPAPPLLSLPSLNTKEVESIWTNHLTRLINEKYTAIISTVLDPLLSLFLCAIEEQRDIDHYHALIKHQLPPQADFYGLHHHFNHSIEQSYDWILLNENVQQLLSCQQLFIKVKCFNYIGECCSVRVFMGGLK